VNAEDIEEDALDLYEHAPCGYLTTDPDGVIVRVNRTFLAWTGYRHEELVGVRRWQDLLSVGGRIYHETHYAPLLRMQDTVREIALDVVRADGTRLPALVNAVLKRDGDGEPRLIRTTVFDATERRRYERELVVARDRERLVRERVERLHRLSATLAAAQDASAVARAACAALSDAVGAQRAGLELEGAPLAVLGDPRAPAARTRAAFAVGGGGVQAVLWVDPPGELAVEERALAAAMAGQVTLALDRALLYEEQRDVAHQLQQALLSGEPPDDPRFAVAGVDLPAGEWAEVGGDW
jgi:PAS domain S-box-containing protein